MESLQLLVKAWDDAVWEYSLVFEGLQDEDVWKRPHPRLASIGEITAHVVYYAVKYTAGALSLPPIESPLTSDNFKFYPGDINPESSLPLSAEALLAELKKVHEQAKTALLEANPNLDDAIPNSDRTWGYNLEYIAFHTAYHAGQAYSVRNLMGHETTDN